LYVSGPKSEKPSSDFLRRIRNRYDRIAVEYDRENKLLHLARTRKRQFIVRCLSKYRLLREGALLVDLGCGTGAYIPFLVDKGLQVVGIDLSISMLEVAKRRAHGAQFVLASMYDLPLRSESFDALLAMGPAIQFHSPTHFGVHYSALLEIQRIAKKGAIFILDLNNPISPLYWRFFPSDILRIRELAYPWSVVKFLSRLRLMVVELASCILLFLPIHRTLQMRMERYMEQVPILRFLGRYLLLCIRVGH